MPVRRIVVRWPHPHTHGFSTVGLGSDWAVRKAAFPPKSHQLMQTRPKPGFRHLTDAIGQVFEAWVGYGVHSFVTFPGKATFPLPLLASFSWPGVGERKEALPPKITDECKPGPSQASNTWPIASVKCLKPGLGLVFINLWLLVEKLLFWLPSHCPAPP